MPRNKSGDDAESESLREWDAEFAAYKLSHPGATFATFYVRKAMEKIEQGRAHTTLGGRLHRIEGDDYLPVDFEEAGRAAFDRYVRVGGIEPRHRVVDYGCGSLRLGVHFINYLDSGKYFGLDVTTDFIGLGKSIVGNAVLAAKQPQFDAINEDSLRRAAEFAPDIVISNAVSYHVHPDEIGAYLGNLKRLAHKKGAILFFDARLSAAVERYRKRGWAMPLSVFEDGLAPLVYAGRDIRDKGRIVSQVMEFRRL